MSKNGNTTLLKEAILSIYENKLSGSSSSSSYGNTKGEFLIGRFKATVENATDYSINLLNNTAMTESKCTISYTYSLGDLKTLTYLSSECLGIAYELLNNDEFCS